MNVILGLSGWAKACGYDMYKGLVCDCSALISRSLKTDESNPILRSRLLSHFGIDSA